MNKLDLTALLERVRNAVGSSIELDRALSEAFGERNAHGVLIVADRWLGIAPFTSSIDAALALVEHVLPGWMWSLYHEYVVTQAPNVAFLKHKDIDLPLEIGEHRGDAATMPIAILLALLLALTSNQEANDETVR